LAVFGVIEALPIDNTKLKAQAVFQSVKDRDVMLRSVMVSGIKESYDRLAELLEKMQKDSF